MSDNQLLDAILKELQKQTALLESIEYQVPEVPGYENALVEIKGELQEMKEKLDDIVTNTGNQ